MIGIIKDCIGIGFQWKIETDIDETDQKKYIMIDNKELAKYIKKRMKGCRVKGLHGEWLYVEEPAENELEFWIQQFKTKDCCGHSEWSERFQRNIWIKDEED